MNTHNEKLPVKHGLGFVQDAVCKHVQWTRKQAQAYIDRSAKTFNKKHGRHRASGIDFHGIVVLIEPPIAENRFFRVCLAAQPMEKV